MPKENKPTSQTKIAMYTMLAWINEVKWNEMAIQFDYQPKITKIEN